MLNFITSITSILVKSFLYFRTYIIYRGAMTIIGEQIFESPGTLPGVCSAILKGTFLLLRTGKLIRSSQYHVSLKTKLIS